MMLDEPMHPEAEPQGYDDNEADEISKPIGMMEAVKADNLVPLLKETDVNRIGSQAVTEYAIDLATCQDFHKRYDSAMAMAMQESKPKTFPWPKASNVIYPLLTQSAIQFQARAYPAIIDGGDVVKCIVLGSDPDAQKQARAVRVAAHMNWQFLHDVPGWEEDTDKLLLQLPIVGTVFRKVWYDSIARQNNAETISAKDFVVNMATVSLDKAPRFTHVQRYYPHEVEAFIRSGLWVSVKYDGDDGADPHSQCIWYEQFRLIDMDDDGLPEPYVVTVTPDGAVARIVACYDEDGIKVSSPYFDGQKSLKEATEALQPLIESGVPIGKDAIRVVRIVRKEYIVKYGFIPSPDGTFYDQGFGTITEGLGAAINTINNQLIDAGTLSNMQGGFIGGGTKLRSGNMSFSPGEWKRVEGVTSGPLRDNILPLQLPGPSPVLFQLLGTLIESVKGITSVSDILSGNQDSQTAPTTALALIEQGQKVFTAIYQRIHRALGVEISIFARLNRDYLDEKEYFAINDVPGEIGRADYQDADLDIQPVSDPRAINDRVKAAKAQILMAHNGDPLVNQIEIRKREFEAAGIVDVEKLLTVPEQGPPPDVMAKVAASEAAVRASDAMTAKTLIEAATAAYALGTALADTNIQSDAQRMLDEAIALADVVKGQMNGQPTDTAGGVPPMDGQPDDAGLPPIPAGPGAGDSGPVDVGGLPIGADGAGSSESRAIDGPGGFVG